MKRRYTHRVVKTQADAIGALCSEHYSLAAANKARSRYIAMSLSKNPDQFKVEPII